MNTVAIVLAAGTSSRFSAASAAPANKLLLPFGETCVVHRAVRTLLDAGLREVCVVTGYQADAVRAALTDLPVRLLHNPRYREGEMVSSVQVALQALLPGTADTALIALGDMPLVPISIIQRIVEAYARGCGRIVAPRVGAQRGHPVLIARAFWPDALALPDGAPMRRLLQQHADEVALLQVNTEAVLQDVDTPVLYTEALKIAARNSG